MLKISIISSSIRIGRNSHRVALYLENLLRQNKSLEVEIIDLKAYDFPIFEERLRNLQNPEKKIVEFAEKIKNADGIIIVTPEYNGGYPASLKNASDLLYDEWYKKPIAFAPVSAGQFGGSQVITSIQFSFWKMRALLVPSVFHTATVEKSFDENGVPANKETTDNHALKFVDELIWCMEAKKKMEE